MPFPSLSSLTFFPMSCAASCHRIRQNTASKECHRTRARMPSPERWTTCPSVRRCTARATFKGCPPQPKPAEALIVDLVLAKCTPTHSHTHDHANKMPTKVVCLRNEAHRACPYRAAINSYFDSRLYCWFLFLCLLSIWKRNVQPLEERTRSRTMEETSPARSSSLRTILRVVVCA